MRHQSNASRLKTTLKDVFYRIEKTHASYIFFPIPATDTMKSPHTPPCCNSDMLIPVWISLTSFGHFPGLQ